MAEPKQGTQTGQLTNEYFPHLEDLVPQKVSEWSVFITKAVYWLRKRIQLIEAQFPVGTFAEPPGGPGGPLLAPEVSDVNASEGPDCVDDGVTLSEVAVSWMTPSDTTNWGGVNIYMLRPGQTQPNYAGGPWTMSPQKFETPPTGETVTLFFVSQSIQQVLNPIASSPTTTVLLDGQPSPPNPVSALACQQVVDGLLLSWNENTECDLAGYEVADTGDVAPPNQASIGTGQVIAELQGFPGATRKATYRYKSVLYSGTSDGTTITMSSNPGWPVNGQVVGGSGKNVHFTLSNEDHRLLSNTEDTLTFASGSIPTGDVDFYLRGANGEQHLYVRAVNNSKFKSDWRPIPPAVLACPPIGPDGTTDQGVADIQPTPAFNGSYFICGRSGGQPSTGRISIKAVAVSLSGATVDPASRSNIGGVTGWTVKVTYTDLASGGTDITAEFSFGADTSEANYLFHGSPDFRWYLTNYFQVTLPNVEVTKIELRVVNYFGTSDYFEIAYINQSPGPYYTGFEAPDLLDTAAFSATPSFDVNRSQTFEMTLTADVTDITITSPTEGRVFTLILWQDGTGGRTVTWPAAFKGAANYELDPTANTYSAFVFQCRNATEFLLVSTPITGAS